MERKILEPEEVGEILQYLCGYLTDKNRDWMREAVDDLEEYERREKILLAKQCERLGPDLEVWNYFDDAPFVTEDINLQYVSAMTDPLALFRPQILKSWYGTVRGTKVFIVLGTDEGLNIPSCILTGETNKDLLDQVQTEFMKMVYAILPKEIIGVVIE